MTFLNTGIRTNGSFNAAFWFVIPLTVLGLICAMVYPAYAKSAPMKKVAVKACASALFVAGALIFTVAAGGGFFAGMMLAALICGAFGDVFLSFRGFKKELLFISFLTGGLFFFAGHILYLVLFFSLAPLNLWLLFLPAAFIVLPIIFAKPIGNAFGTTKVVPLACLYAAAVGLVVMATLNLLIAEPSLKTGLLFTAGVLFAASDTVLTLNNALKDEKRKLQTSYIVAALYYSAQWIFVYTVFLTLL